MSDSKDNKQIENLSQKKKNYFEAREGTKLTLRKKKLDDRLRMKRELTKDFFSPDSQYLEIDPANLNLSHQVSELKLNSTFSLTSAIAIIMQSTNIDEVKYCIFLIRKLTMEKTLSLEGLLNTNIIDAIYASFKTHFNENSIIYECLWILINLSFIINSADFVTYLLSNNWFTIWEMIMKKDIPPLTLNLLWVLNNLAINSIHLTYLIYEKDFFTSLFLPLLMKDEVPKLILTFGFSIISLGIEYLVKPKYQPIQGTITKLLCDYHTLSEELIPDILKCLAQLSNLQNESIIKEIFICGIMRRIIRREIETTFFNQKDILMLIGNILSYVDEKYLDLTVMKELVIYLKECLVMTSDNEVRKNACWCLSNICCGSVSHLKCILNENLFPILADIAKEYHNTAFAEALFCISNLACSEEIDIALQLTSINIIDLLVDAIIKNEKSPKIIVVCLDALLALFQVGAKIFHLTNKENVFLNMFEVKGGKEVLGKLTQYSNKEVYDTAVNIINRYYNSI